MLLIENLCLILSIILNKLIGNLIIFSGLFLKITDLSKWYLSTNLSKNSSNISQVDIVKNSFIDKSVVSAKLTQLDKKKLIKKMKPNDNRSNKLALTKEGMGIIEKIINDVVEVENVFFSKLNQETFNFINSLKLLLGKKIRIKANYNE